MPRIVKIPSQILDWLKWFYLLSCQEISILFFKLPFSTNPNESGPANNIDNNSNNIREEYYNDRSSDRKCRQGTSRECYVGVVKRKKVRRPLNWWLSYRIVSSYRTIDQAKPPVRARTRTICIIGLHQSILFHKTLGSASPPANDHDDGLYAVSPSDSHKCFILLHHPPTFQIPPTFLTFIGCPSIYQSQDSRPVNSSDSTNISTFILHFHLFSIKTFLFSHFSFDIIRFALFDSSK